MSLTEAVDTGPRERHRHDAIVLEPITAGFRGEHVIGHRAKVKSPFALDRYQAIGALIDKDEPPVQNERRYAAGDRLRARWTIAGLEPTVIGSYAELIASGPSVGFVGTRRDAYQDWIAAIRAVGIIASNEVVSVCCLGEYIGKARMILLRRGLAVLADYYRIE